MVTKVKVKRQGKKKICERCGGAYLPSRFLCTNCSSDHTVQHGSNRILSGKKARRKCQDCAHTFYEVDAGRK